MYDKGKIYCAIWSGMGDHVISNDTGMFEHMQVGDVFYLPNGLGAAPKGKHTVKRRVWGYVSSTGMKLDIYLETLEK